MSTYMRTLPSLILGLNILVFILLMTYHHMAFAQVNVEQSRPQAQEGFSANVDGSMTLIRGNVSLSQTGLATKFNYVNGVHSPFIQLAINYGEKDQVAFLNQSFAHARWTAMWQRWIGSEIFAQLQEDSFRSLILRQLYGGGLRSHILEGKSNSLALGLGLMYEREIYQENRTLQMSTQSNRTNITENNIRLTQYISSKTHLRWSTEMILSATIYYQPRVDLMSDYRLLADLGIEIKLSQYLRLVESLNLMYDSAPPDEVKRTDLKSISSLRLVF